MNFVAFDAKHAKVKVAEDFWIYVAFSIPLTVLTLGAWFYAARKSKDQGRRRMSVLFDEP